MEKGFFICSKFDEIEVYDLLLHRYGDMQFIMNMRVPDFLLLIAKAKEKEQEERYFQQWVVQLPHMGDNYISFEDYVDELTDRNLDLRPVDEILKESQEIEKRLKGGDKA